MRILSSNDNPNSKIINISDNDSNRMKKKNISRPPNLEQLPSRKKLNVSKHYLLLINEIQSTFPRQLVVNGDGNNDDNMSNIREEVSSNYVPRHDEDKDGCGVRIEDECT